MYIYSSCLFGKRTFLANPFVNFQLVCKKVSQKKNRLPEILPSFWYDESPCVLSYNSNEKLGSRRWQHTKWRCWLIKTSKLWDHIQFERETRIFANETRYRVEILKQPYRVWSIEHNTNKPKQEIYAFNQPRQDQYKKQPKHTLKYAIRTCCATKIHPTKAGKSKHETKEVRTVVMATLLF